MSSIEQHNKGADNTPEAPPYDLKRIALSVKNCSIPYQIHFTHSIDSTMQIGRFCQENNIEPKEGTVLIAAYQTNGVGYNLGSSWEGSWIDIKMTLLVDDRQAEGLNSQILTGTALQIATVRALRERIIGLCNLIVPNETNLDAERIMLKWHNDVYVDYQSDNTDKHFARKISGAMCPGDYDLNPQIKDFKIPGKLVCGVGVNMGPHAEIVFQSNSQNEKDLGPWPISLHTVTKKHSPTDTLMGRILYFFDQELGCLRNNCDQFCENIANYLFRNRSWTVFDQLYNFFLLKDGQKIEHVYKLTGIDSKGFHVRERSLPLSFTDVIRIRPQGYRWRA